MTASVLRDNGHPSVLRLKGLRAEERKSLRLPTLLRRSTPQWGHPFRGDNLGQGGYLECMATCEAVYSRDYPVRCIAEGSCSDVEEYILESGARKTGLNVVIPLLESRPSCSAFYTMAPRSHIFCVPFPGFKHAVSMFHVAVTLASPSTPVHVLVLSKRKARKWLEATGQTPNEHITFQELSDGTWEGWTAQSVAEHYQLLGSSQFTASVEAAVMQVEESFPEDKRAAMVYNAYMMMVGNLAVRRGMKPYILVDSPYYTTRLAGCYIEGEDLNTTYLLNGIGGSERALEAQIGGASDMNTPLFDQVFKPALEKCAGMIFSNTNVGIEGDDYEQTHLPAPPHVAKPVFMIGPSLPSWFENYLDGPDHRNSRQKPRRDECLDFLDSQASQSVVYIALGGHAELEQWQAKTIIDSLRKHSVPWILLFRNDTSSMRQLLARGGKSDGVVTEWAPQLDILVHPAIRCVVAHGGFGTMMEGVFAGHCFIASPVSSVQFINSKVMAHLGISLGTLAENTHLSAMHEAEMVPHWPNNSGKHVEELFDHLFGTKDGERALQQARVASLALRQRIKEAKKREGPLQVQALYQHMLSEEDQGNQRLFPSFMLGPW